ncbi:MAG: hypothetical protein ACTHJR_04945 [Sphingomonas sp.]|uniref:hypothetical protein n=1 Tax=Sphingomonas sp. TaxID=28214 RepID=UPI003F820F74
MQTSTKSPEFHNVSEQITQSTVDSISQYASPAVWSDAEVRRVLNTGISLDKRVILLLASAEGRASQADLFPWLDHGVRSTFNKRLAEFHRKRFIETKAYGADVQLLPPGAEVAAK